MSPFTGTAIRRLLWGSLLGLIITLSALAPILAPTDPLTAVSGQSLKPSSEAHLLGTDLLGRDVLSRLWYGGRQTLTAATLAALISIIPGGLLGLAMGYFGGWVDLLFSLLLDALLAFPPLLTAFAILTVMGSGVGSIAIAVGLAGLPVYARITRSAARAVRVQPYIESARAIGARPTRIILYSILPNAVPTLISFGGVLFSWALLNESALAFLGFTGDPATPDWGVMLAAGRITLLTAPIQAIAAGAMIMFTVLAVNQLAASFSD